MYPCLIEQDIEKDEDDIGLFRKAARIASTPPSSPVVVHSEKLRKLQISFLIFYLEG